LLLLRVSFIFYFLSCRGQDFEKAGELRDKEMDLKAKITAITGAAKEENAAEAEAEGSGPMVTDQDIANIVSQWTGIPIEKARHSRFTFGVSACM
jgi:ATP-dependent Clp protease ATP-binding subunit ClpA